MQERKLEAVCKACETWVRIWLVSARKSQLRASRLTHAHTRTHVCTHTHTHMQRDKKTSGNSFFKHHSCCCWVKHTQKREHAVNIHWTDHTLYQWKYITVMTRCVCVCVCVGAHSRGTGSKWVMTLTFPSSLVYYIVPAVQQDRLLSSSFICCLWATGNLWKLAHVQVMKSSTWTLYPQLKNPPVWSGSFS